MTEKWRLRIIVELLHLVIFSLVRPKFSPYTTKKRMYDVGINSDAWGRGK